MQLHSFLTRCIAFTFLAFASLSQAQTQSVALVSDPPDAPDAAQPGDQHDTGQNQQLADTNSTSLEGRQTKRILGIVPNFRSVSVDEKLPPQSMRDKFITTTLDSFDYSAFIFAGILAGISQAEDSCPEFHQGAGGYGRYYWHTPC